MPGMHSSSQSSTQHKADLKDTETYLHKTLLYSLDVQLLFHAYQMYGRFALYLSMEQISQQEKYSTAPLHNSL